MGLSAQNTLSLVGSGLFVFFSCIWNILQTLLFPKVLSFNIINNHNYISLRLVCVKARGPFTFLLMLSLPPSLLFMTWENGLLSLICGCLKQLPNLWSLLTDFCSCFLENIRVLINYFFLCMPMEGETCSGRMLNVLCHTVLSVTYCTFQASCWKCHSINFRIPWGACWLCPKSLLILCYVLIFYY